MGLIVDGIEDWISAYNNSSKYKLNLPTFTDEEQKYYAIMRISIKLFEKGYLDLNNTFLQISRLSCFPKKLTINSV